MNDLELSHCDIELELKFKLFVKLLIPALKLGLQSSCK